jgi:hypothetical protein
MKKRVKNACQVRRYYASGIPMYRHRNELVDVPANKMVTVIKVMTALAICQFGDLVVAIPNDNFLGDKITKAKAEKAAAKKTKKVKAVAAEEPAAETPVEAPTVDTAPTETAPTEPVAEDAPAPAPEAAPVEQPAEMAAV